MFQFRSLDIDKAELLRVLDKTSQSLHKILDNNNIQFVFIDPNSSETIKNDYDQQWPKRKKGDLQWDSDILIQSETTKQFTLALYSNDTLCGLSLNLVTKAPWRRRNALEIYRIEGQPNKNVHKHPLKGYVIAAFSLVNLNIAKTFNFGRIKVYHPEADTIASYERLGYKDTLIKNMSLTMSVKPQSQVNFDAAIAHHKVKACNASKYTKG